MCGILGVVAFQEGAERSKALLKAGIIRIAHRGPDDSGTFTHGRVALGHARLSIIDLSAAGHQPMTIGDHTIVYNGEVYNYKVLREELQGLGVTFVSGTDTEVVLQAFIQWGKDALPRFNGFFAFAIHNAQSGEVFLARDRFGIKPLYYSKTDEVLKFASEVGGLMAMEVPRELDEVTLFQYLQLTYVAPDRSIYKGVSQLGAGQYLTISADQVHVSVWYDPYPPGELKGDLGALLSDSVGARLMSDVPLGTFLSGGVDSSVITLLANEHQAGIKTFTIGFPDDPYHDESGMAEEVARYIGTNHTMIPVRKEDLFENLDSLLDSLDQPFADPTLIAQYILSQKTKEHVTVALSGDGADEVFGGYNKHKAEFRARNGGPTTQLALAMGGLSKLFKPSRDSSIGNTVRQWQRFYEGARLSAPERYWMWASFAKEDDVIQLFKSDLAKQPEYQTWKANLLAEIDDPGSLGDVIQTDIDLVLGGNMLSKTDLMSMAHGLEVRVPFLDHRVVEHVIALKPEEYYDKRGGKWPLHDLYRDRLPTSVFDRPKHGFDVPIMPWMQGPLRDRIEQEYLAEEFIQAQGIFDPISIQGLKERLFSNNPGDLGPLAWSLVVFQHWYKKHMG
jgi:asparagine synthase (glutamine-hydrolysing)